MDGAFRFVLRLLLIPSAVLIAVTAQTAVILFGQWEIGSVLGAVSDPEAAVNIFSALMIAVYFTILLLGIAWTLALVGILFSEAFAVRSWIFHLLNGLISLYVAMRLFPIIAEEPAPLNDTLYIVSAGFAGGLIYWLIAGWSAGFWKPVLAVRPPPAGSI